MRKSLENSLSQARGPYAVLASVLWVLHLKDEHKCFVPYQLERLLEPTAFRMSASGRKYHLNKWPRFEVGKSFPSRKLIMQVEERSPGSSRLALHPLWGFLKALPWNPSSSDEQIRRLSTDVQATVLNERKRSFAGASPRRADIRVVLKMLERKATLDALAALVVLLNDALHQDDENLAFRVGETTFRTLLILCACYPYFVVAKEFFWLFELQVFPRIREHGVGFDFSSYEFDRHAMRLHTYLLILEDNGVVNGIRHEDAARIKQQMLDGHFGQDIEFAMLPPIAVHSSCDNGSSEARERCSRQQRKYTWGMSVLQSGRYVPFAPGEVG